MLRSLTALPIQKSLLKVTHPTLVSSCHQSKHSALAHSSSGKLSHDTIFESGSKHEAHDHHLLSNALHKDASNIFDRLLKKINKLDQKYERLTGIARIRQMQEKVWSAQKELQNITEQSESCQRDLDDLRDRLRVTREKIDAAVRPSETFIKLIEAEEQLLKEEIVIKSQLSMLRVKRERSMENFSRVLGLSHEVERTRQEKSKYVQLLYVAISFIIYLIQKSWLESESAQLEQRLSRVEEVFLKHTTQVVEDNQTIIKAQLNQVLDKLDIQLNSQNEVASQKSGWSYYVPGLTSVMSWLRLS